MHTWQDIDGFLARVRDPALKRALSLGVGIVTETMPAAERSVVDLLFESGAIQVRRHGKGYQCGLMGAVKSEPGQC